jgi:8-oxo-dGTP pyrophosphatase MutT (NUDIX family)
MMKQELKTYLARREKLHLSAAGCVPAAVLMPLYCKEEQYYVLFTKRTSTVATHKGEISFPGGRYEKSDGSLLNTALRESAEEIGLKPAQVEILGELDDTITVTSSYVISPFVALIPYPYVFRLEKNETEEIIEVPLESLINQSPDRRVEYKDGKPLDVYTYKYQGRIIFGATARILYQFLDIWQGLGTDRSCRQE